MKQVMQRYSDGEVSLAEVPVPIARAGCILVHNVASLVSVGTEKLMLDLAGRRLVGKVLA